MNLILRKTLAEDAIDNLQSFCERLQIYHKSEGGFSNDQQRANVETCITQLKQALLQPRSPNAGEYVPDIKKGTVDWAAQAWVDGRSQHLEDALESTTDEERRTIEERAVHFLKLQIPKYSWQHHQQELASRVLKRMEQQLQNVTMLDLPNNVRNRLIDFKTFKRGDKYNHRKHHTFAWGEKVYANKGKKRIICFVCRETNFFVSMIDKNGNEFKKKKSNVIIATNRERIIDRLVREIES